MPALAERRVSIRAEDLGDTEDPRELTGNRHQQDAEHEQHLQDQAISQDGWTNGRMDGWTDGRMDGWTDGWMDGRAWCFIGRTDPRRELRELMLPTGVIDLEHIVH